MGLEPGRITINTVAVAEFGKQSLFFHAGADDVQRYDENEQVNHSEDRPAGREKSELSENDPHINGMTYEPVNAAGNN